MSLWLAGRTEKVKPNLLSTYCMPGTMKNTLLFLSYNLNYITPILFNFQFPLISILSLILNSLFSVIYCFLSQLAWVTHVFMLVLEYFCLFPYMFLKYFPTYDRCPTNVDWIHEWMNGLSRIILRESGKFPSLWITLLFVPFPPVEQGEKGNKAQLEVRHYPLESHGKVVLVAVEIIPILLQVFF